MNGYLAVDIGASSGRHIFGWMENDKLFTEEVYRFQNEMKRENGALVWDMDALFEEVLNGIRACREQHKTPKTIAIDTWAVDYVLLDAQNHPILPVYAYRDARTKGVPQAVEKLISMDELYHRTGIQKQNFNTIYQLYCDQQAGRLENAAHFLMIPEYLSYRLTGICTKEYTNATTTNLVFADSCEWDEQTINTLSFPRRLFDPLKMPGTLIGSFTEEVKAAVGMDCNVVFCPSHDTASAVAACPLEENAIYLSSGTWSLIGVETKTCITNKEAQMHNYTNEGGIDLRYRFLKNIMGMWLFQNIKQNLHNEYSYDAMMQLAKSSQVVHYFDVNDPDLTAPEDMITIIREKLGDRSLPLADLLNCVYHSLAAAYGRAVDELEQITGRQFDRIHVIGGGSRDSYLNELVCRYTKRRVFSGPVEATAIGNLMSQIMADQTLSLAQARAVVSRSFDIKEVF